MLDLANPLGIYEGLIFYGDHEIKDLVYYFPDEVSLAPQQATDANGNRLYELFFQIFNEGDTVEGGIEDLRKTAGSIFSLGVQCTVAPPRLQKAISGLKNAHGLPDSLSATVPPWKDGTVNLMVLDKSNVADQPLTEDSFVKSIVGSNKPSLMSTDLKSVFNVRLDCRGTALIQGALEGDTGNVAGVMYDLKFNAIRPSLNLRIWANLGRCYDSVSQQLGIKLEFTYYVKVSLGAELSWLTKKLEENGDLKIEVLSEAEDAESKKMIDEMVKDFKESVLKELFQPYVNPQTPSSMPSGDGKEVASLVPVIGVSYKFTEEKITHDKVIDVDYRERAAIVRTHNPQSHLWVMGEQIGTNKDKYIQHIEFGKIWQEQALSVQMVYNFDDPAADLLSAEVIIWRNKYGVAAQVKEGHFALPEGVDPIKDVTFHKGNISNVNIAWFYERDEPVGYYYQLRFLYSGKVPNVSSPSEIITAPVYSTNEDLVIFPDTYTFYKIIEVREGNISYDDIKAIDITLRLKDADANVLDVETLTINAGVEKATWAVRGKDKKNLFIEATKEFQYKDNRPSVKTEPVYLQDDELIINKPFLKSNRTIIPVIAGPKDIATEILLEVIVDSPQIDQPVKTLYRITGPQFLTSEITVPLSSDKDKISYEARAIMPDGTILEINKGDIISDALVIDLKRLNNNEVTFTWQGRSPAALDLKTLKVELRKAGDPPVDLEGIVYQGDAVPGPVTKVFSAADKIEWRIVRRLNQGGGDKTDFKPVDGHEIIVSTE